MRLARRILVALLCLPLTVACVRAQPAELYKCVSWGVLGEPDCGWDGITQFDLCDGRAYYTYSGRAAWFPLNNEGPVIIEVEANPAYSQHFPLYVEIVALQDTMPRDFCLNGYPGIVVGETWGAGSCGADWVSFGPMSLLPYVPLGGSYALQFEFFATAWIDALIMSPGIDCVRVRPASSSSVASLSWGRAKTLYR